VITVEEAKLIIVQNVDEIAETISIPVKDARGFRLSEPIYSPIDLPPFNQSNVDGYAVNGSFAGWNVVSEIKAGDAAGIHLKHGEAARIFTGAMVPSGSDAVIMQEKIKRNENNILIMDGDFKVGEHIRKKGSQIKEGELALPGNSIISPSVIGFISSMGLDRVKVFKKPEIVLLITGNELQESGTELRPGNVYESSSAALSAAVNAIGLSVKEIVFVKDEKRKLADAVGKAIKESDLLLISGGVSVGDYDFVNEVLQENETETLFYKVSQKPGKPLLYGRNGRVNIFGLPGNPASALTCFYEYVYPCLRKQLGHTDLFLKKLKLPVESSINKKKGLSLFLRAVASESTVASLDGQESFKMRSFADANAFIYLPLEMENVAAGELVEVHLLPAF